jgi:hypothetical protein
MQLDKLGDLRARLEPKLESDLQPVPPPPPEPTVPVHIELNLKAARSQYERQAKKKLQALESQWRAFNLVKGQGLRSSNVKVRMQARNLGEQLRKARSGFTQMQKADAEQWGMTRTDFHGHISDFEKSFRTSRESMQRPRPRAASYYPLWAR